jgi:hypothetical protein
MWKRLSFVKRQGHGGTPYTVGGFTVQVRPDVEYFNLKMADSIQEWRKRWFYVSDEPHDSQVPGLPEFNANAAFTKKRSWRPLVEKASFVPVRKGHSSRSPNRDGAAGTNASPHSSRPCYEPG